MSTENSAPAQQDRAQAFADEHERIQHRRKGIGGDIPPGRSHWGLAISGGGIRSATCGLGVLQALALASRPPTSEAAADAVPVAKDSLLREFDYVSSVSGGGYIASFFISLFVPGRLRKQSTSQSAAADAYDVLAYQPPGRMHRRENLAEAPVGKGPMSWLRENGRYLAPTGGGDMMYAAALAIRNWFAVQYVLGTLLIATLALLALIRGGLALHWHPYAAIERDLRSRHSAITGSGGVLCGWFPRPGCCCGWRRAGQRSG